MNGTLSASSGVVEVGGCTGVLISPRAILTAAHCVDGLISGYNGWANRVIRKWEYNGIIPQKVTAYNGLHVNHDGSSPCTPSGNKQRAVRLQHKVAWIEDMLDVTCTESTTGDYVKCW